MNKQTKTVLVTTDDQSDPFEVTVSLDGNGKIDMEDLLVEIENYSGTSWNDLDFDELKIWEPAYKIVPPKEKHVLVPLNKEGTKDDPS